MDRTQKMAFISLICNIAFSIYHLVLGIVSYSWWLLTLGFYYLILSIVRFTVLRTKKADRFFAKFTGWMLIALTAPLIGTVILSIMRDRGHKLHMIIMIAMAAYAFTNITLTTIRFIKSRQSTSATLIALRNISLANAFVSIFALQRSMLVTFEGMSATEIVIMNAVLGSVVCVIVFLLGLNLLPDKKVLFRKLNSKQ